MKRKFEVQSLSETEMKGKGLCDFALAIGGRPGVEKIVTLGSKSHHEAGGALSIL